MLQVEMERRLKGWLQEANYRVKERAVNEAVGFLHGVWEANQKINLLAGHDLQELLEKHFLDSLALLRFYDLKEGRVCDLGSGGGFPGVPLKIFCPEVELYLLESSRKKINALKRILSSVGLQGVYYLHGRSEMWARDKKYREAFDYMVVRAVAGASTLAELGLPLVKTGGTMFLYKGPRGEQEMSAAEKAIKACGGRFADKWIYSLSKNQKRVIYAVIKERPTPWEYPRKVGIPEKKPLGK